MGAAPIILEIILACILVGYTLYKYGDIRMKTWYVTATVFIAWLLSVSLVFILPIDVSSTVYTYCKRTSTTIDSCSKPWSFVSSDVLDGVWKFIYWTLQLLTWIIIPFMTSYVSAGDFTPWARSKTAIRENLMFYLSISSIFAGLFIYVAVKNKLDIKGLNGVIVAASNTWALLFLVGLLGYGLVEVPRSLWYKGDNAIRLRHLYFKASHLRKELEDAENDMNEYVNNVTLMNRTTSRHDPMRPFVNILVAKVELLNSNPSSSIGDDNISTSTTAKDMNPLTMKAITTLHGHIISTSMLIFRLHAQWEGTSNDAFLLEDAILKSNSSSKSNWLRWVHLRVWWYRALSLACTVLSCFLIWSEITFFHKESVLSLYALFMQNAAEKNKFLVMEFICFISLLYMCICAYSAIFRIRIFNYYHLVPNHLTDNSSLLFCAGYISRLTFPLCLNFLSLAHMDISDKETALTHVMGHMNVVSFIAEGFNIYFPIAIVLFSIATLFSLGSRLLRLLHIQQFMYDYDDADEVVEEGRQLLRRERRHRERTNGNRSRSAQRLASHIVSRSAQTTYEDTIDEYLDSERNWPRIDTAVSAAGRKMSGFPRFSGGNKLDEDTSALLTSNLEERQRSILDDDNVDYSL